MAATTTILTDASAAGKAGAGMARWVGIRTRKICLVDFNITSYTTDGEVLPTAASLNMQEISAVFPVQVSATATSYFFIWDSTNLKLIANTATGTQATSTTAVGHVYLMVIGY